MKPNPFKPTAGKMPPVLIGRQSVIDDFTEALDNGAGAPGRLMLISGNRGYGKTVILSELKRIALSKGWDVVSETASIGMTERLATALSARQSPSRRSAKLKSVNVSPSIGIAGVATASLGSVSFTSTEQGVLTLRDAVNARLKSMKPGTGILFTIDEAQAISMENMVVLATMVQHVIADQDMENVPDTQKKGVALAFAALPSLVDDLQNNKVLTFLRRSQREELAEVPLPDVRDAYVQTVRQAGKTIDEQTALAAAREGEGHPYLIQLVGYYMWRSAEKRGSDYIEEQDVIAGKADALLVFYDAVCAPMYYNLRSPERLLIEAMARDKSGVSNVADIAKRTQRTQSWVSKYRASLIREHVVEALGYGQLRFVSPHLGEYIREKVLWHD